MKQEDIKKLQKIKFLIRLNKFRFCQRKDRDYYEDLKNLDLTERQAIQHILYLNENFYFCDTRLDLKKDNNALVFKKTINNKKVYIKLTIDYNNGEEAVCLSFHEDWR